MSTPLVDQPGAILSRDPAAALRSRAITDAKRFRAFARIALSDGNPRAELRAAHARAAARSVLAHARRMTALCAPAQTPAAESLCSTIER